MQPIKLTALDGEDLEIISAHVQDAVLRVGDFAYRRGEKRVLILLNRFDWQDAQSGGGRRRYRRRRAVLRFDRVTGLKARKIRQDAGDAVLNLLAVRFDEADPPGGHVTLLFSGGGVLRLEVECIEAQLADLGAVWETGSMPAHEDEAAG